MITEITNQTGLVFGEAGTEYLDEAISRAAGPENRPVYVVCATNLAVLRGRKLAGAVRIKSREDLKTALQEVKALKNVGVVFHGLTEYTQTILNEVCGENTPVQADWGDAARRVSNDLIELADIAGVLYATDFVVSEEDKKDKSKQTLRLAMNPGLSKLINGHLFEKIYVGQRGGVRVVQTNPKAALDFRLASAEIGTPAEAAKPKRKLAD